MIDALLARSELKILRELLSSHLKLYEVEIFLFGSRVNGHPRPNSDLDVWLEPQKPIPLSVLGALKADLEESELPFRVDLLEKGRVPQAIEQSILRQKKIKLK